MPQLGTGQHGHWMFAEAGNIMLEIGPHPLSTVVRLIGPVHSAHTVVAGERVLRYGGTFFDQWHSVLTCERGVAQCSVSVGGGFVDGWVYVIGQDGSAMVDLVRNTYVFSTKTRFIKSVEDFYDGIGRSRSYLGDAVRNLSNYAAGILGLRVTNDTFSVGVRNSVAGFYEALARGAEPPARIVEARAVIEGCLMVIDSVHRRERQHVQN